jgi:hypothetical protein
VIEWLVEFSSGRRVRVHASSVEHARIQAYREDPGSAISSITALR